MYTQNILMAEIQMYTESDVLQQLHSLLIIHNCAFLVKIR